jgi:hypothetical protein
LIVATRPIEKGHFFHSRSTTRASRWNCALLVPGTLILVYAVLRLFSIQPKMDVGMSDFLTSTFFLSGAAICSFTAHFTLSYGISGHGKWTLAATLLTLVALDESFMIHENFSDKTGLSENYVFAVYGALLLIVLWSFRPQGRAFYLFLALFVVLCGTSQAGDTLSGRELQIYISGRVIDLEQIFEMIGALCLSFAFGSAAMDQISIAMKDRRGERSHSRAY